MGIPAGGARSERNGTTGNSVDGKLVAWVMEWRFPAYAQKHRYQSDRFVDGFAKSEWWRGRINVEGQCAIGIRDKWLYVLNNEGAKRTLKAEIYVKDGTTCYEKLSPLRAKPNATPAERFRGARGKKVGVHPGHAGLSFVPASVDRKHKWFFFLSPVQLDAKAVDLLLSSDAKDLLVEPDFSAGIGSPRVLVPDPYQWTEDSQAFHYVYHLNRWKEYVAGCDFRGAPLKGAKLDQFKARAAKQFISRALLRYMGGPKEFLLDPMDAAVPGSMVSRIPEIPANPPNDDLGIKNEIEIGEAIKKKNKLEHKDWKVPYDFMRKFFKEEYQRRLPLERSALNTIQWVNGAAHRLIDDSIMRSPALVARYTPAAGSRKEADLVKRLPIWVGADHWGRILAWMTESRPGRLFVECVCAPPSAGKTVYLPSYLIYVDKKYSKDLPAKYLFRSNMSVQLFALAYPVMLKHLPGTEAQELARRYYGLLGVGVVKKFWSIAGAGAKLPGLRLQGILKASQERVNDLSRLFVGADFNMQRYFLRDLKFDPDWKFLDSPAAQERNALADAVRRAGFDPERVADPASQAAAKRLAVWTKVEKAVAFVSWGLVAASAYQAWQKSDRKGMAKSTFEILQILAKIGGKEALESACKAFAGAVEVIINLEKAATAASVGNVPQTVGYAMAGGAAYFLSVAAVAGAFPGAGWIVAGLSLVAFAGVVIASVFKDNPYEQFARFCVWGKYHNDPVYANGGKDIKWLKDGRWKDFWTRGKNELPGLEKQVKTLTYLFRQYAVESHLDGRTLWLIVRPGVVSPKATFRVVLNGFGPRGWFNGIRYRVEPLSRKAVLISWENVDAQSRPGHVEFRKDGSIWIPLPFPDVSEASGGVILNDPDQPGGDIKCDHTIKQKSSIGSPYGEAKKTLSAL